ncbi:DUF6273 domain-containing protein [Paenibacillus tepidiphilus]|uniref:DUF6273 domain-containing protein n=1 Tax=Paenibacillus tepidiphilus TaxID=2608683 RepID=UPI001238D357|nr:DUF6273 domain-containing protein [Paenibacillus tepidiphilus]
MEQAYLPVTHRSLKPGDFFTFGMYPQTTDGQEQAILWRVLEQSDRGLLVLSEDILDCRRFHGQSAELKWRDSTEISWQDCDLRAWLNDEFYNTAFHEAEKSFIKTTLCTDNGENCPDTEDKVFLLSAAEVQELSRLNGKEWRRAAGTGYARIRKPDGCSLYVYDKSDKDNYILRDGQETGCSWWWLRTQGNKPSRVSFVGTGCSIRSYGNNSINGYGVRPALTLNLKDEV